MGRVGINFRGMVSPRTLEKDFLLQERPCSIRIKIKAAKKEVHFQTYLRMWPIQQYNKSISREAAVLSTTDTFLTVQAGSKME